MDNITSLLKNEESAVFALRALYSKYGYLPYKMSKFEEYDLYVRNKDFLVSDSVITFNDTNGKLLALKPDVTISIVKNTTYQKGVTQKLFYNENVYRVSGSTHAYKEIMQTGLECVGDVSVYDIAEVLMLSLESLKKISENFVLDVSHMGVISALFEDANCDRQLSEKLMRLIGEKNMHELKAVCKEYGVAEEKADKLASLVGIYGKKDKVIEKLYALSESEKLKSAVAELESICNVLETTGLYDNINIDFSIVNNMSYYNGIVFKGYIDGVPESVLSGGQYDKLLKKMGKKGKAIGFAVYLDLLEQLQKNKSEYDVDFLAIYDDDTDPVMLSHLVKKMTEDGNRVSVQRAIPEKLRYKTIGYVINESNGLSVDSEQKEQ